MFPVSNATLTRYFPFCPALLVMLPFCCSSLLAFNMSDVLAAFVQKPISVLNLQSAAQISQPQLKILSTAVHNIRFSVFTEIMLITKQAI